MERAVLPPLLIFIFLLPLSVPAGALLCCIRPESSDQTSPGKKQPFLVIRVPNWLPGGSSRIRFSLPLGSSHDSYWGFSHGCPTRAKQQDSPISERAAVQRRKWHLVRARSMLSRRGAARQLRHHGVKTEVWQDGGHLPLQNTALQGCCETWCGFGKEGVTQLCVCESVVAFSWLPGHNGTGRGGAPWASRLACSRSLPSPSPPGCYRRAFARSARGGTRCHRFLPDRPGPPRSPDACELAAAGAARGRLAALSPLPPAGRAGRDARRGDPADPAPHLLATVLP